MINLAINFINLYQKYLSPDHSASGKLRYPYGYCRFYPTCSEYTKQALVNHGLFRGLLMAFWRVLRCNPFTSPAVDPVKKIS